MKRVLIIGANSAIAEAVARQLATRGDSLYLVARNAERVQALTDDLRVRGAPEIGKSLMDVRDASQYQPMVDAAVQFLGDIDIALIAHGTLTDQKACEEQPQRIAEEFDINAVSVMLLSMILADRFERQGRGVLAVISSVAGDRGRKSNYVYGAAKAAVTAFTSGLRQRLFKKGVTVLTIKPGFVDSPMTAAFPKGALWAKPADVAKDIVRAMDKGTPVLYTPWFWRLILFIVRSVPERIFMRA